MAWNIRRPVAATRYLPHLLIMPDLPPPTDPAARRLRRNVDQWVVRHAGGGVVASSGSKASLPRRPVVAAGLCPHVDVQVGLAWFIGGCAAGGDPAPP